MLDSRVFGISKVHAALQRGYLSHSKPLGVL